MTTAETADGEAPMQAKTALRWAADLRQARRTSVVGLAVIRSNAVHAVAQVENLSQQGAKLTLPEAKPLEGTITLKLPLFRLIRGTVVWVQEREVGCAFEETLSSGELGTIYRGVNQKGDILTP